MTSELSDSIGEITSSGLAFDIFQTEGEPLPELETKATGDAGDLMPTPLDVADELDITHQC